LILPARHYRPPVRLATRRSAAFAGGLKNTEVRRSLIGFQENHLSKTQIHALFTDLSSDVRPNELLHYALTGDCLLTGRKGSPSAISAMKYGLSPHENLE
jgi:hypothetical protein